MKDREAVEKACEVLGRALQRYPRRQTDLVKAMHQALELLKGLPGEESS